MDDAWLRESYRVDPDSKLGALGVASYLVASEREANQKSARRVLQLRVEVDSNDSNKTQGEILRRLEDIVPSCRLLNLAGATISITFRVPAPLARRGGQATAGAQVGVESYSTDGVAARQYGVWADFGPPGSEQTITITPTENEDFGWKDKPFMADRAQKVVFKIALNDRFRGVAETTVDITSVSISWPSQNGRQLAHERNVATRCPVPDDSTFRLLTPLPVRQADITFAVGNGLIAQSQNVESIRPRAEPANSKSLVWEIALRFPSYQDESEGRTARVIYPLEAITDVTGKNLSAWVALGPQMRGAMLRPNLAWLDLYDEQDRVLTGAAVNTSIEGVTFGPSGCESSARWMKLEVEPLEGRPIAMGGMMPGFRADRVKAVGLRFVVGRFSHLLGRARYPLSGRLLLSGFTVEGRERPERPADAVNAASIARTVRESQPVPLEAFLVGVNYPWFDYGDVGVYPYGGRNQSGFYSQRSWVRRDFRNLCRNGVQVVRVFLLSDLRSGLIFKGGRVTGLDRYVARDIDALVEAAAGSGLRLVPVLVDFLAADGVSDREYGEKRWKEGEAPQLLTEPNHRTAFVESALAPLVRQLQAANRKYPGVVSAVDIANEIENATAIGPKFPQVQAFVREVFEMIRREAPGLPITLGSRDRGDLATFWSDFEWDFAQFHYYPDHELLGRGLDYPAGELGFPGPIVVGEVEPSNIEQKLDLIHSRGYAGAFFWAYRSDDGYEVDLDAVEKWVRRAGRKPSCQSIPRTQ